jgi:hypothetical protein
MLMNASSRGSDPSSVFRPRLSQQAIKLLAAEILRAENLSCAAGKTDRYDLVRRAAVNARKTNRTAPNCRLRNSACSGVGYMRTLVARSISDAASPGAPILPHA